MTHPFWSIKINSLRPLSKKRLRLILPAIVILILCLTGVWVLSGSKPLPHLSARVTRSDLNQSVLASGVIEPVEQINVGAQVNGQLKTLRVKLGAHVKKGELLAEIDPVLAQNELRKVQAGLHSARARAEARQAQLIQYQLDLERQDRLFLADAASRSELEIAQSKVSVARADLTALKALIAEANVNVDTARANLGYTRILAPIDGNVIAVITKEGQTVVSAQAAPTLLILANLNIMTIKAKISEADIVRVKPGQDVSFTILGLPERTFESRIRAIEPAPKSIGNSSTEATEGAVYYNALFDISNTDGVLRPAMTAQVNVVQAQAKSVLIMPVAALGKQQADGRYEVRLLINGKPEIRLIEIGLRNDIDVEVRTALHEGDMVVVGEDAKAP